MIKKYSLLRQPQYHPPPAWKKLMETQTSCQVSFVPSKRGQGGWQEGNILTCPLHTASNPPKHMAKRPLLCRHGTRALHRCVTDADWGRAVLKGSAGCSQSRDRPRQLAPGKRDGQGRSPRATQKRAARGLSRSRVGVTLRNMLANA